MPSTEVNELKDTTITWNCTNLNIQNTCLDTNGNVLNFT